MATTGAPSALILQVNGSLTIPGGELAAHGPAVGAATLADMTGPHAALVAAFGALAAALGIESYDVDVQVAIGDRVLLTTTPDAPAVGPGDPGDSPTPA